MQDFVKKAMVGLSVMGGRSIESIALIVAGNYDLEIKCAFFQTYFHKSAESLEALEVKEVLGPLERLKDHYRRGIQEIFEEAAKQDKAELLEQLKETNKPHEMGTVSEIAAKYGISKSEVRRRKADGSLHELTDMV